MKKNIKPLIGAFVLLSAFSNATAQVTNVLTLNFDSVNASATANGVNAAPYLASFGIMLTNVNPPETVRIADETIHTDVIAPSPHNFLLQNVPGSPNGISFTLLFRVPLQSFTFTRPALRTYASTPIWKITAYSGTNAVDSAGVDQINGDLGRPAHTYHLNGPNITSVTLVADGEKTTGISSMPLDDFQLVSVEGAPNMQSNQTTNPPPSPF